VFVGLFVSVITQKVLTGLLKFLEKFRLDLNLEVVTRLASESRIGFFLDFLALLDKAQKIVSNITGKCLSGVWMLIRLKDN